MLISDRRSRWFFTAMRCLGGLLLLLSFCPIRMASAMAVPHGAKRVRFAPGKHRLVIEGAITEHSRPNYVLYAKAGQHLGIEVRNVAPEEGLVTIWHVTFPSGEQFGTKGYDPFDGRLTETGPYVISINVNNMATEARTGRFRLTLTR